jgi:phosphate acyltransferase
VAETDETTPTEAGAGTSAASLDSDAANRVALDAMGGDHAPGEIVKGAVDAAGELNIGVILVGPEPLIKVELAKYDVTGLDLTIVHTDEVVGMDEHPAEAVRTKRRNSITLCHELVRDGKAIGAVSAGNSGAVLAASIFTLRRTKGVERPAFGAVLPAAGGKQVMVLDIGGNTDCKPQWLLQFALMGAAHMTAIFSQPSPRVGLLSNGEEETKGDQLVQETHQLIKGAAPSVGLNFIGNVEGRDIVGGEVDVVVCDGLVGNVVLKFAEGLSKMLLLTIRGEITAGTMTKVGGLLAKPAFDRVRKHLDYEEYGGVPILGVNGVSVICHGSSHAKAIKSAIRVARQAYQEKLPSVIAERIQQMSATSAAS